MAKIKEAYSKAEDFIMQDFRYRRSGRDYDNQNIPVESTRLIMKEASLYPKFLVSIAENVCWRHAISKKSKVGDIAKKEKWFEYKLN